MATSDRDWPYRGQLYVPQLQSFCEGHFEEKCFEEDVKARLMGTKPRKNLKPGSFPTIFVHRRPKEGHDRALRLLKRSAKQEINQLLTAKDQPPSMKLCQPLHCSPKETPLQQETLPPQRSLKHKSPLKIEKGEDNSDGSDEGCQDDEKRDPHYEPDADLPIFSITNSFATKAVEEQKYLVFEANIEQLCYHIQCSQCSSSVTDIEKQVVGSGLLATLKCISSHVVLKWTSQPLDDRMPIGYFLCSAATMFSGLTYQRVAQFMKFLNLQFFSATTFYDLQKMYLIPEINSYWDAHQKAVVDQLKGSPTDLIGDGRCDSPGFSAKYCSYSLMDVSSEKVVDMELVQVSETGASQEWKQWASRGSLQQGPGAVGADVVICGLPVLGQHEWSDDPNLPLFQKCGHDPLTDLQQRKKIWLKAGSSAHEALKKYAPKRLEFGYSSMTARLKLAAIDHNQNVGRAKAVVKKPHKGSSHEGSTIQEGIYKNDEELGAEGEV
ncbi:hypothetical protein BSL78_11115 [Apostichopus japonicus]|uniref:THAP-type domain-containing protein n=1 Tax=Stichopus japonicus TaxID=307972 RepID=A0A2G8KVD6_STIJA|nr:hypothetical protein BSL78_11115 [Apostichopus japonicus]